MAEPVLNYASLDPAVARGATIAAVFLCIWCILDLLFGGLFMLGASSDLLFAEHRDFIAIPFLVVGIATFFWGVRCAVFAARIARHAAGSASSAAKACRIAEVVCYLGILMFLPYIIQDHAWRAFDLVVNYGIAMLGYMFLPVFATLTRLGLRNLARRMP